MSPVLDELREELARCELLRTQIMDIEGLTHELVQKYPPRDVPVIQVWRRKYSSGLIEGDEPFRKDLAMALRNLSNRMHEEYARRTSRFSGVIPVGPPDIQRPELLPPNDRETG